MHMPDPARRDLLKAGTAAMAAGALGSLGGLYARQAQAVTGGVRTAPTASPYGPLAPTADLATGLPLLQLPRGFRYRSFGWTGDMMADGQPCPGRHDGMAVMRVPGSMGAARGRGRGPSIVLVRNHEIGAGTPFNAPAMYDTGDLGGGQRAAGGTTNLIWRDGAFVGMLPSLGGTLVNCAGGPTPWGTWLTCEEIKTNAVSSTGRRHGYVFEVHPDPRRTSARPLIGLGRFSHEAVAIDPRTGAVYLTEDDRNKAGLYRFVPNDRAGRYGSLENGGRLQAARVRGRPNADLTVAQVGDEVQLEWIDVRDPDLDGITAPAGFPDIGAGETLSGPFAQGWADGALRMARGEGIWHANGKMFIVDTATGVDARGRKGRGNGAVWVLDLATQRMRALFVSGDQLAAHNPDNVTVSPRGGVVLCEDGGESPDAYGPGARLIGLTRQGESFYLAKNNVVLEPADLARAGKRVEAGDHRDSEFCGACWDPAGRTLFVNLQTPGITVAIEGPWHDGPL
ncbi:alkaline phosphatase PhoX [Lysobacter humi (ex Lee et al. 2017)]